LQVSGYLATKSLLKGPDYDMLWKRDLKPMLEISLINRHLFETFGHSADGKEYNGSVKFEEGSGHYREPWVAAPVVKSTAAEDIENLRQEGTRLLCSREITLRLQRTSGKGPASTRLSARCARKV